MTKKVNTQAKILSNIEIRPNIFLMEVVCPEIAKSANPGQFCMLSPHRIKEFDPLLRRPLSIHNVDNQTGKIQFLYRVVGRGTRLLSFLSQGDRVALIGPLGRGFEIDKESEIPVIVGGGLGIAPLLFLVKALEGKKAVVIIGAITKNQLLRLESFTLSDIEVLVATEDGSFGNKGLVTEVLDRVFANLDSESLKRVGVYTCGPMGMLRAIWHLCQHYGVKCQVSLETQMACGTGLCLGCAVPGTNRFLHVCKDGPCFDAREIDWDQIF